MKLNSLLKQISSRLAEAGIVSANREAELIVSHVLQIELPEVFEKSLMGFEIESSDLVAIEQLVQRREQRVPLQHLTGKAAFRNLELGVGPGVFIPRPETEILIDLARDFLGSSATKRVVDVGTGSGAIAISIAREIPESLVTAIEVSGEAFKYAQQNVLSLAPEINLLQGDFETLLPKLGEFDLIVSNPPYIPNWAVPKDPEVRDFDPKIALYSGDDGLDAIRALGQLALASVREGGMLLLEHADIQSASVVDLLLSQGWKEITAHQDLTGRDRAVSAVR